MVTVAAALCQTRNVVHKPCTEQGCTTLAVFNEPGAGHGLYCGQHKPPGLHQRQGERAGWPVETVFACNMMCLFSALSKAALLSTYCMVSSGMQVC